MKQKSIYLDYAATTPMDKRVLAAMQPYQETFYGNSSSVHHFAARMRNALDTARETLAKEIGASTTDIILTSSATEANNLALKGFVQANRDRGNHLILSSIEHASVYETVKYLESQGFETSFIKVNDQGYVNLEELRQKIRKETILVSIMQLNNEIGTIQPLAEIGNICGKQGIAFHTDAAQGFGRFDLETEEIKADLISASSHKIYGPLGSGFLYVKSGTRILPQQHGGGQEQGLRASTVNVPAVVGFAEALKYCAQEREEEIGRLKAMKTNFLERLKNEIPGIVVNGDPQKGSPYILNLSFPGCDAEILAMQLDQFGIAISTGSACASGTMKHSRVLQSINRDKSIQSSAIRFSFGRLTTVEELEQVAGLLPDLVRKVRKIS